MKQKPKTGTIAPGYCKEAGRMVLMSYEGEAGRLCLHNENETDDRKEVLAWIKEHNQNKKMKGGDMKYVLVEFPEDSSYFEDNGIGYPCCESEDNGARYVPEEDYVKVFGRKPDDSMLRRIVQWPESQELTEDEDFEEYCECVYDEKGMNDFICPAYWAPVSKMRITHNHHEVDWQHPATFWEDRVSGNATEEVLTGERAKQMLEFLLTQNGKKDNYQLLKSKEYQKPGYFKDKNMFTAFDNTTNKCIVEEFELEEDALKWLKGDYDEPEDFKGKTSLK